MKVAKPNEKDFDTTVNFLNAAELALDRDKYSIRGPEEKWHDLDEDDPDRKMIEGIIKSEGKGTDERIIMFEFLKRKFAAASTKWRRVYWASTILVENCCDIHEDCLAYAPHIFFNHVTPEQ